MSEGTLSKTKSCASDLQSTEISIRERQRWSVCEREILYASLLAEHSNLVTVVYSCKAEVKLSYVRITKRKISALKENRLISLCSAAGLKLGTFNEGGMLSAFICP